MDLDKDETKVPTSQSPQICEKYKRNPREILSFILTDGQKWWFAILIMFLFILLSSSYIRNMLEKLHLNSLIVTSILMLIIVRLFLG